MSKNYKLVGRVTDASTVSAGMLGGFSECELASIRFYNEAGALVTPTAGTVKFEGSPDGETWRDVADGTFLAADAYKADRVAPYALGLMLKARLTLTGVTGASTFKAVVWRN